VERRQTDDIRGKLELIHLNVDHSPIKPRQSLKLMGHQPLTKDIGLLEMLW
jgi:hypothetical protein